jgi:flagellin-like protein
MMKKMWKNRSGVSPVIATILMVAITVVLAAVLYVMVMGFGGTNASAPSGAFASAEKSSTNVAKYTFSSMSKDTKFVDCKFTMGVNGTMAAEAKTITGTGTSQTLTFSVSSVSYTVTFTDLGGDGKISTGDYVTISTTTLHTGDYTATLLWAQDGSQICTKVLSI